MLLGHLTKLAEGIKNCYYGQMGALETTYTDLHGIEDAIGSPEDVINGELATAKNNEFDSLAWTGGNVHAFNDWKYEMQDLLGLRSSTKPFLKIPLEQLYGESKGNIMKSFYNKFTTETFINMLVNVLTREKNGELLNQICIILRDKMEDEDERTRLFDFGGNKKLEIDMAPNKLTYAGVEELLVRMNILGRRVVEENVEIEVHL